MAMSASLPASGSDNRWRGYDQGTGHEIPSLDAPHTRAGGYSDDTSAARCVGRDIRAGHCAKRDRGNNLPAGLRQTPQSIAGGHPIPLPATAVDLPT